MMAESSGLSEPLHQPSDEVPKKYKSSAGPLLGFLYQYELTKLFLQKVPNGEFFLAHEMDDAGKFDDIIVKYEIDGKWRFTSLQAKSKLDAKYELRESDLFDITEKSSTKKDDKLPFRLKKYFNSFCKIKNNNFFKDADCGEFIICTNATFHKDIKKWFEWIDIDEDPILGNSYRNTKNQDPKPEKYKLREEDFKKLKLQFGADKDSDLNTFISSFRIVIQYTNDEINNNIKNNLEKCLAVKSTELAVSYLRDQVNQWFQRFKNSKNKYLTSKDKEKFLDSFNNMIESLFIAGHSRFFIDKLRNYDLRFKNTLDLQTCLSITNDVSGFIITTINPLLSTIKILQIFEKFELKPDEVIFVDADELNRQQKILDIFFKYSSFKWLVIYCPCETKINKRNKEILDSYVPNETKQVVIVGQENDVLELISGKHVKFDDTYLSFKHFEESSQKKLLEKEIVFQGKRVGLNQLIDVVSAAHIIGTDETKLLLEERVEIGENIKSDFIEDYYIPRILLVKEVSPSILQDEELLKKYLFFITAAKQEELRKFNLKYEIMISYDRPSTNNGIVYVDQFFDMLLLCNSKPNCCWIEYKKDRFYLKKVFNSKLGIPKMYFCENDLRNERILENKVMIIANGPGFGKTTFLTNVAKKLKEIGCDMWVLQISLMSYAYPQSTKSLKEFTKSDTEAAIKFIADICYPENKDFTKQILIESLSSAKDGKFPKIILLFDGFDEISPTFKENTLNLLKALKNSNVTQMWITTRVHEEFDLENALGSPAMFFNALDEPGKETFIIKFWEYIYKTKFNTPLPEIIRKTDNSQKVHITVKPADLKYEVLNKIKVLGDTMDTFTDSPLQLKMVAELFFQKIIVSSSLTDLEDIDWPSLFKEFINIKFDIYCEEKGAAGNSVISRDNLNDNLKILRIWHQIVACKILIPEHLRKIIEKIPACVKFFQGIESIKLTRAGLLVVYGNELQFVHRSFAEYFLSEYLTENFELLDIQKLVFEKVFLDNNFQLVRTFLNHNKQFVERIRVTSNIPVHIKSKDIFIQLKSMVTENNLNLMLSYLKNSNIGSFEEAFLYNSDRYYGNILNYILTYAEYRYIPIELFWAIKESVSLKTFNNILLETTKYRFWLATPELIYFIKENCGPEILTQLLCYEDNSNYTLLHYYFEYTTCTKLSLLEAIKAFSEDLMKKLLVKRGKKEQNVCYYVIELVFLCRPNMEKAKSLLKFVQRNYDFNFFWETYLRADTFGSNILSYACIFSCYDIVVQILESVKDQAKSFDIFFLKTDDDDDELQYTCFLGHDHTLFISKSMSTSFIEFVKSNCCPEMLNIILYMVNAEKWTILHMACRWDDEYSRKELLTYLLNILYNNNKELLHETLLKTDDFKRTVLHYSVTNYNEPLILKIFLDFVDDHFSKEIRNELLLKIDNYICNIFHYSFLLNHNTMVYLLNIVKNSNGALNQALLERDIHGYRALDYCTYRYGGVAYIPKELLDFVESQYSSVVLNSLRNVNFKEIEEIKRGLFLIAIN